MVHKKINKKQYLLQIIQLVLSTIYYINNSSYNNFTTSQAVANSTMSLITNVIDFRCQYKKTLVVRQWFIGKNYYSSNNRTLLCRKPQWSNKELQHAYCIVKF